MNRELTLIYLLLVVLPPILLHFIMLAYALAWSVLNRRPFISLRNQSRDEKLFWAICAGYAGILALVLISGMYMLNTFIGHVIVDCGGYVLTPTGILQVLSVVLLIINWVPKTVFEALVSRGWSPGYGTVLVAWLPIAIIHWLLVGWLVYYEVHYYSAYNC